MPIDSAPKDGTDILIVGPKVRPVMASWRGVGNSKGGHLSSDVSRFGEGWTRFNCCDTGLEPTHWQPLPAPPVSA